MLYKITLPLLQKVSQLLYFVSRPLASKEEARVNAQKRSTTEMSLEGVCLGKILHCSLTPYHTLFFAYLSTLFMYVGSGWRSSPFNKVHFPRRRPIFEFSLHVGHIVISVIAFWRPQINHDRNILAFFNPSPLIVLIVIWRKLQMNTL